MSTFKSILIHAVTNGCTRDILLSSSMTLYQLHKLILIAFELNESSIIEDYHYFTLVNQSESSVQTSFEIIEDNHLEIDGGFLTPVIPGVYIEHTHPHEPLPLFSIYYKSIHDEMSFRMIRDERYCTLSTLPSSELYYEFQTNSNNHPYSIHLNLQSVNLPIHFLDQLNANPKIIYKSGDLLNSTTTKLSNNNTYFLPLSPTNLIKDESLIKNACHNGIKKLIQERKRFLLHQQQCEWIEPTGEKCVYCALLCNKIP